MFFSIFTDFNIFLVVVHPWWVDRLFLSLRSAVYLTRRYTEDTRRRTEVIRSEVYRTVIAHESSSRCNLVAITPTTARSTVFDPGTGDKSDAGVVGR